MGEKEAAIRWKQRSVKEKYRAKVEKRVAIVIGQRSR